jgi:hypothetical protein
VTPASRDWKPFSARVLGQPAPDDSLYEGTPDHLDGPLRSWLDDAVSEELARRIFARLRWKSDSRVVSYVLPQVEQDRLLDAVDAALFFGPDRGKAPRKALANLLEDGGSAYRLTQDQTGLERRVDPAVTQIFRASPEVARTSGQTDVAKHLEDAWRQLYGLHPDPSAAYRDAIRAVEAAAIPVVIPTDPRATLGGVLSSLRQGRAKWELAIAAQNGQPASIDPLAAMLALLWEGHRDRHPGGPTSAPITQPAAEAAVHLAATLAHWFVTGAVRRTDP